MISTALPRAPVARAGRRGGAAVTAPRALFATLAFVALWQGLSWGLPAAGAGVAPASFETVGWTGLYVLGLGWSAWLLELASQRLERRRFAAADRRERGRTVGMLAGTGAPRVGRSVWNPLDPAARYYGARGQRLKQSLLALFGYTLAFVLLHWLLHLTSAQAVDPYELPAGGGQETMRQTVQIRKVVRKKYVINPFSTIKFSPPPIDQIDTKLLDETRNEYRPGQGSDGGDSVGDGDGEGGGYGSGTGKGKVRFIRLRHADRGWDKNFGIGGDNNILPEFAARTGFKKDKVAEKSESIDVGQLAAFEPLTAPPLVYVGGIAQFALSAAEKKVLREYLIDKHGMVLGDNLGGPAFHQSFVATMSEVTGASPVPIPRDDYIHRVPSPVPDLPIVVAHGGTVPLGWKVDGRWVAYYHPGALSDAWRDDHAGIRRDVYQACYQLGVNVIAYAHREAHKWRKSKQQ